MLIFGLIVLILGIIFPLLINGIPINYIYNTVSFFIIYGTVAIFFTYSTKTYSKDDLIKNIKNDTLYLGSLWGILVGSVVGLIILISYITDISVIPVGLLIILFSILYGVVSAQIIKILKSSIQLKNIKIESLNINIVTIIRIFIAFIIIFMCFYWIHFDFKRIFKFEDLISFLLIFTGIIIASKKYKILLCLKNNDSNIVNIKDYLDDLVISSLHVGIIVLCIRTYIVLNIFESINHLIDLLPLCFVPLLYSVIMGIMIFKPMKLQYDD